ncbi:MAG TPA: GMC family oxidoreductase [Stellaceae bacterium]|jgi:gluconate 2-dehydrogenase alpha chain|nr:GMC family oxidoreductase [Stellaceae bacterium]
MPVLPKADVVIVGYGAAAGPLALELAQAGYEVVALERGPHLTTERDFRTQSFDTLRWVTRRAMIPDATEMPLTFRNTPAQTAIPFPYRMASMVGGSSVHWSGQSWRFYEDDFRLKSTLVEKYGKGGWLDHLAADGAALADWPLSYHDLEPFYDKAEYNIGIGGWPGNIAGQIRPHDPDEGNPFEAPRARDFPFRPLRDSATDIAFRNGAAALGLKPFHVPTAITTDDWISPYGIARSACTYCAYCSGYGCWNGAKSSSLVALLPATAALPHFTLRANAHVTRINHRDGRAHSVTYVADGREFEQPGEIVVLAAYSFQNVRLLLASGIDGNGQVGKYFINRPEFHVSAVFDDRYLNGFSGPSVQRQAIDDYNGENAAEDKLRLGKDGFFVRGAVVGSAAQRLPLESYEDVPPDVPRWGAAYQAFLARYLNRYLRMLNVAEALPYEDCAIDLDPTRKDKYGVPAARVTRSIKTNERRMAHFVYDKTAAILTAAGAAKIWGRREPIAVASMVHDCGGLRMGTDPASSATNRYGQLWAMPNVLATGGALFPTISGHNPTETIWALSYWQSAALRGRKIDLGDAARFLP